MFDAFALGGSAWTGSWTRSCVGHAGAEDGADPWGWLPVLDSACVDGETP